MDYPCYLLEPTGYERRYLRRYTTGERGWTCAEGWHEARTLIGRQRSLQGRLKGTTRAPARKPPRRDARWPRTCSDCGYEFAPTDTWQLFTERLYRVERAMPRAALEEGDEVSLRDAPPGAMWFADWMNFGGGPDGRNLVVKCPPSHDWMVDGRASNCTMPEDNEHRCWPRQGEAPEVTVDKSLGPTCSAGGGSILVGGSDDLPGWHGFLRQGVLVEV